MGSSQLQRLGTDRVSVNTYRIQTIITSKPLITAMVMTTIVLYAGSNSRLTRVRETTPDGHNN